MPTKNKTSKEKVQEFDFREIRTYEDACKKLGLDPEAEPEVSMIPEEFKKALKAIYRLFIIFKAVNNGWEPDWSDNNQQKYWPWFWLSGVSGFSFNDCGDNFSSSNVGSRLCCQTYGMAKYIGQQFLQEYMDLMVIEK